MFICIKIGLALNNQKWLICHKTKLNQTKPNHVLRKLFNSKSTVSTGLTIQRNGSYLKRL